MHASYLSLALLAIGATAAPSSPSPGGKDAFGSFPFMPVGSSSVEDEDEGFGNPVPAAMAAMQMAESVQASSYSHKVLAAQSTPAPTAPAAPAMVTPTAAAKENLLPAVHSNHIPAMGNSDPSLPMPVAASPTSHALQATPEPTQAHHVLMESMSFSTHVVASHSTHAMVRPSKASATPAKHSASASASASPTATKAASPLGPLGSLLGGLPMFNGLLGRH